MDDAAYEQKVLWGVRRIAGGLCIFCDWRTTEAASIREAYRRIMAHIERDHHETWVAAETAPIRPGAWQETGRALVRELVALDLLAQGKPQ